MLCDNCFGGSDGDEPLPKHGFVHTQPKNVSISRHVSPFLPVAICVIATSIILLTTHSYRDQIADTQFAKGVVNGVSRNSDAINITLVAIETVLLALITVFYSFVESEGIQEGWSDWWPYPSDIQDTKEQWTEFHYPELGRREVQLIAAILVSICVFSIVKTKSRVKSLVFWVAFNSCAAVFFWLMFSSLKCLTNEKRPDFFARCYGMPVVTRDEDLAANAKAFEYLDKMFFKNRRESDPVSTKDCLAFQQRMLTGTVPLKATTALRAAGYLDHLRANNRTSVEREIEKGFRSFPSGHWGSAVYYGTVCLLLTCWAMFKSKSKAIFGLVLLLIVFLGYNAYSMFTVWADRRHHSWDMVAGFAIAAVYVGLQFCVWLAFRPRQT
eukprot:111757_1